MYSTNAFGKQPGINPVNSSPMSANIAIVGVNRLSSQFCRSEAGRVNGNDKLVGCIKIPSDREEVDWPGLPQIIGEFGNLHSIVKRYQINKIVLAISENDQTAIDKAIRTCEKLNIAYEVVSNTMSHSSKSAAHPGENMEIGKNQGGDSGSNQFAVDDELWFQRVFDLIVSTFLFLLFLPSLAVIAIIIKLESRGPVLYSQERVGKDGKTFNIFKFRSMYVDAEKHSGPQLARQNDPRITKVGLVLRKTRLDEIPQLFNILRGDMSLIGPRPDRPYFVEKYSEEIPGYELRLKVKPGLTGYAQVESGYDESLEDVKTKLSHDLYYIEHRGSVKLFHTIVYKTIWVVLTARGQ